MCLLVGRCAGRAGCPGADGVFAVADVCPHLDLPLAAFGPVEVRGERLICPWHYWEFDVRTGQCLYAPLYQDADMFFFQIEGKDRPAADSAGCLTRFPARVHAGRVQVLLPLATA
jgi:nitrite reductase/ring-hydroxylating ferredoxin subunit